MAPLTVFDLDGVLTHHDTTGALVLASLRRRPHRTFLVAPIALAAYLSGARSEARPRLHRALVRIALGRMQPGDYDSLVERCASELARRPGFRNRQAERALRAATATGPVVVATAAERRLASAYLRAVDLPHVSVIASQVSTRDGYLRFVDHNVGRRKLECLLAAGFRLRDATLYTDSLSDLPLAEGVGRCVLVNASSRITSLAAKSCREVSPVSWR